MWNVNRGDSNDCNHIYKILGADFILFFHSWPLFTLFCYLSISFSLPILFYIRNKIFPAGIMRNKLSEHFSFRVCHDLQLLHMIAAGEKFDYAHVKSGMMVMSESLCQTVHSSWVRHSTIEHRKDITEETFKIQLTCSTVQCVEIHTDLTYAKWFKHVCLLQVM